MVINFGKSEYFGGLGDEKLGTYGGELSCEVLYDILCDICDATSVIGAFSVDYLGGSNSIF